MRITVSLKKDCMIYPEPGFFTGNSEKKRKLNYALLRINPNKAYSPEEHFRK